MQKTGRSRTTTAALLAGLLLPTVASAAMPETKSQKPGSKLLGHQK
jgi:hypothetical protein